MIDRGPWTMGYFVLPHDERFGPAVASRTGPGRDFDLITAVCDTQFLTRFHRGDPPLYIMRALLRPVPTRQMVAVLLIVPRCLFIARVC